MRHLLLFPILFLALEAASQDDVLTKGEAIPDFTILSENGKQIDFSAFKQKVVLINFFATWCGPCLTELPILQSKVWEKYKNNPDFSLLVIGRGHSDAEVKAFKDSRHFDLPMYADKSKEIYSLFATKYIPRNYLIDKDGKIVYLSMGYEENEFEKMLNKLDELLK